MSAVLCETMSYICTFYDEHDVLQLGEPEIEVEVHCGPSWSEWSGGDPGHPASIEVDGWHIESITPITKDSVKFGHLDPNKQKEVYDWVEDMIYQEGIKQIEQYETDTYDDRY